jgi:hypothetical protein
MVPVPTFRQVPFPVPQHCLLVLPRLLVREVAVRHEELVVHLSTTGVSFGIAVRHEELIVHLSTTGVSVGIDVRHEELIVHLTTTGFFIWNSRAARKTHFEVF